MDADLRSLERLAKTGDLDAAIRWFHLASRTGDLVAIYEAMMLLGELQHPGLMKQLNEINEMLDMLKQMEPPVEDSYEWRSDDSSDPSPFTWGCSSVGRAPHLQCGGQGCDSLQLHSTGINLNAETVGLRFTTVPLLPSDA